ncbi:MAG: EAL domain-containing protein [Pseudomonadota bacterium]
MIEDVQQSIKKIQTQLKTPLEAIVDLTQRFDEEDNLTPSQKNRIREILDSVEIIHSVITALDPKSKQLTTDNLTNPRILIVEDNLTNQELLLQQLQMLGFSADTADNGKIAIDKLTQSYYQIILTDLNMPLVDGYELTKKLRKLEQNTLNQSIIIAITANALVGEKEKCLAAGMDAYLSKPLNILDLKEILAQWQEPLDTASLTLENSATQFSDSKIIDRSYLINSLGNDYKKHVSILKSYLKFAPEAIHELLSAYKNRNIKLIHFYSHKLKSSSRSIGAIALADNNQQIEKAAEQQDWDDIDRLCPQITHLYADIERAIENIFLEEKSDNPTAQNVPEQDKADLSHYTNILVIDDDEFILSQLSIIFKDLGFKKIITVNNAQQALNLINRFNNIDLLLCDLNMPEIDGISVLRRLSECSYRGSIILISGEDKRVLKTAFELAKAHQLKVMGFLEKPISQTSIIKLLQNSESDQSLHKKLITEAKVEKDLGITIEKLSDAIKNNLLTVYFQPQLDLLSNQIIGAEALVRWIDPELGFIAPDIFIPIAEEQGLIDDLTNLVIEQSLFQLNQWQSQGYNLKLSINFSIDSFTQLELPDLLLLQLKRFDIKPSDIVLEVTERRLMDNMINVLEVISRLRLQGFALSIDDFGTGYSTMEQLQKLPFTELKIDGSFVYNAGDDPEAKAILESSIELANKIKLQTVAEGVETQDDINLVKSMGCTLAQGYFIAKPMPAEQFIQWYTESVYSLE